MSPWPHRDAELASLYPSMPNVEIAERMGLTRFSVDCRARRLKLRKSEAYLTALGRRAGEAANSAKKKPVIKGERLEPMAWIAHQVDRMKKPKRKGLTAQDRLADAIESVMECVRTTEFVTYAVLCERLGISKTTASGWANEAINRGLLIRRRWPPVRGVQRPDTFEVKR